MKKGEQKRRQKALKKRAERKQARQQAGTARPTTTVAHILQARGYPIEGCWAQEGWDDGGLAVVVVARRQPAGDIVTGAVEFGHKGKPLYIQGPHDNAQAVMRQLTRTAGEGNFDFLLVGPELPAD